MTGHYIVIVDCDEDDVLRERVLEAFHFEATFNWKQATASPDPGLIRVPMFADNHDSAATAVENMIRAGAAGTPYLDQPDIARVTVRRIGFT